MDADENASEETKSLANLPYFHTSTHKLLLLSWASFSLYTFYWLYANFRAQPSRRGGGSPAIRTLLTEIFIFPLLRNMTRDARALGITTHMPATLLGILFFVYAFSHKIAGSPFSYLLPLFFIWPNRLARAINFEKAESPPRTSFSTGNWLLLLAGLILHSVWLF